MRSYSESYKSEGVDIEAGYESVRLIKDHVKMCIRDRSKADSFREGL